MALFMSVSRGGEVSLYVHVLSIDFLFYQWIPNDVVWNLYILGMMCDRSRKTAKIKINSCVMLVLRIVPWCFLMSLKPMRLYFPHDGSHVTETNTTVLPPWCFLMSLKAIRLYFPKNIYTISPTQNHMVLQYTHGTPCVALEMYL